MWSEVGAGPSVLTPDLYRLGEGTPSLDTVADGIARLLDAEGVDRAVLVGCSLGGYVAMAFLRGHADRVSALALLGTRAAADDEEAAARRLGFAAKITDPAAGPALTAATTPLLLGRTNRTRLLPRVTAMVDSVAVEDIAWAQRAIAVRPASYEVLAAFDRPAVVLVGEEDELVTADDARATVAALPAGRLEVVREAGHLLPLEAPEVVTKVLEEIA
ncbi:MAG: alpha/beta fold hydrolase [Saccharothrix sp.]|nr:alpha/beta fold hydrolase [Saccharothrix sp.]